MFLYTTSAKWNHLFTTRTRIIKKIKTQVAAFNTAERLSSANNQYAQIRLVHTAEIPDPDFSIIDKNWKLSDHIRLDPAIIALKNQYQADIVSTLFYSFDFYNSVGSIGFGWMGFNGNGAPATNSWAFNFTNIAVSREHTVIHEIGHNFGADHNIPTLPSTAGNRAFESTYQACWICGGQTKKQQTIMYKGGDERFGRFSNPAINVHNVPIGAIGYNNHYTINNNKCTVAMNSLQSSKMLYVAGASYACPGESVNLKYCNFGLPNHGATWYTSTDAINWTPISNSTSITVFAPPMPNQILYIKFELVTQFQSATLVTLVRYHTIQSTNSYNGLPCQLKTLETKSNASFTVDLYPNPAQDFFNLQFESLDFGEEINATIIDLSGQIVQSNNYIASGYYSILINTTNLPSGNYIVVVKNRNQIKELKLTVL